MEVGGDGGGGGDQWAIAIGNSNMYPCPPCPPRTTSMLVAIVAQVGEFGSTCSIAFVFHVVTIVLRSPCLLLEVLL